jgi:predicted nucleic acid-binding protein
MKKALRVASDSSCLIGLAQIDRFVLLRDLFSEVYIPIAVYDEVVIKGKGQPGSEETLSAVKTGWLIKATVHNDTAVNALTPHLGKGEAEVIILSQELGLDYALMDEKRARNAAALMKVKTMGVLGIIEIAIVKGFSIDKRDAVDQLKRCGFRISNKLYKKIFSG